MDCSRVSFGIDCIHTAQTVDTRDLSRLSGRLRTTDNRPRDYGLHIEPLWRTGACSYRLSVIGDPAAAGALANEVDAISGRVSTKAMRTGLTRFPRDPNPF